jgi:hypothetical protein
MVIRSLEKMESIVKENKLFSWDGWTVVILEESPKGKTSKYGKRIENKWYIEKRYEPSENGWTIPDRLLNGQA